MCVAYIDVKKEKGAGYFNISSLFKLLLYVEMYYFIFSCLCVFKNI